MKLVLLLVFILAAIIAFIIGFFINFHFKKLGIDEDIRTKKIIKVYKTGGLIIFLLSLVSLILLLIK